MNSILSFIKAHGFTAALTAGEQSITVLIPYTSPMGDGYDWITVRTMKEARLALGY